MKLLVQITTVTSMLGSAIASMEITAGGQQNHQYQNGDNYHRPNYIQSENNHYGSGNYPNYWNQDKLQNKYPSGGDKGTPVSGNKVDCNAMLVKVNQFRKQNGKGPLKLDAKLTKASQLHSDDQARSKKMSHTGSNGSSVSSRIDAQNYKWSGLSENIAWNQKSIEQVMNSWITSPGHRKNLLGDYIDFGCGFNNYYWTQDFGKPSNYNKYPSKPEQPPHKPEYKPTQPEQKPTQPEQKPTQPEQKPNPGSTDKHLTAYDRVDCNQMLIKVNEFRKKNNKQPLQLDDRLVKASQLHSDDQARTKKMTHSGSNGSSLGDRVTNQKYVWGGISENIAWNQKSIDQAMESWINSDGHRKNLLGNYKHFGCGFNNFYWTQDFASPMSKY